MVSLNSRRFVYFFKNQIHDLKTLECSNSRQKVRILLKKLGEIKKIRVIEGNSSKGLTILHDRPRCLSF